MPPDQMEQREHDLLAEALSAVISQRLCLDRGDEEEAAVHGERVSRCFWDALALQQERRA